MAQRTVDGEPWRIRNRDACEGPSSDDYIELSSTYRCGALRRALLFTSEKLDLHEGIEHPEGGFVGDSFCCTQDVGGNCHGRNVRGEKRRKRYGV